jgi:multisubunit Na+/H+ antiporter MnhE subunit
MQYGYWKVRVIQKHRLPASIRHLVPGGFIATLFILGTFASIFNFARWMFAFVMGLYLCANLAASLITCIRRIQRKYLPVMPVVFAAYHFGYGWGFLRGVIDFVLLKRCGRSEYKKITR